MLKRLTKVEGRQLQQRLASDFPDACIRVGSLCSGSELQEYLCFTLSLSAYLPCWPTLHLLLRSLVMRHRACGHCFGMVTWATLLVKVSH